MFDSIHFVCIYDHCIHPEFDILWNEKYWESLLQRKILDHQPLTSQLAESSKVWFYNIGVEPGSFLGSLNVRTTVDIIHGVTMEQWMHSLPPPDHAEWQWTNYDQESVLVTTTTPEPEPRLEMEERSLTLTNCRMFRSIVWSRGTRRRRGAGTQRSD